MIADAQPDAANQVPTIDIDAFAFAPTLSSRIIGLGGSEPGPDESYVFHSPYVQCGEGKVVFTAQFSGLAAKSGTLVLAIYALPTRVGAVAYPANLSQFQLRDVAASGGEVAISVTSAPDVQFALLGNIYDSTDARADAVTVRVQRSEDLNDYAEQLIKARRTVFGAKAIRAARSLISNEPATLAHPVSQMCTAAQFDEPAFDEWLAHMRLEKRHHRKQWEFVYILQVLREYGMLQEGARGLGFGVGTEPLPAVMAQLGCSVVATDVPEDHASAGEWNLSNQHLVSAERLRRPDICPNEIFDQRVSFRPVDMTEIPEDLTGFDFTWSSCAFEHLGSIAEGLRFVEASVQCLKWGGVAVHTTEMNLTSNDRTVDNNQTVLFRRKDFERLALSLISRGHQVAQINYDQGTKRLDSHVDIPPYSSDDHLRLALTNYVTTSFGIIVRRGVNT